MKRIISIALLLPFIPFFVAYGMNEEEALRIALLQSAEEYEWQEQEAKALEESAREEQARQKQQELIRLHAEKEKQRQRVINTPNLSEEEQLALALEISMEDAYPKHSTQKAEKESTDFVIRSGEYHDQGFRETMEDAAVMQIPFLRNKPQSGIFAIFDGHAGDKVAKYAAKHLVKELQAITGNPSKILEEGLRSINKKLATQDIDDAGSCAIVALLDGTNLTVANIGDSRAILSQNGEAIALSEDHNGDNPAEKERIEKITGRPQTTKRLEFGPWSTLGISRALGDFNFDWETLGLIGDPEIKTITINPGTDFLILACDGIFEGGMTRQQAVDIVRKSLEKNAGRKNVEALAAQDLVEVAMTGFEEDNSKQQALQFISESLNAPRHAKGNIRRLASHEFNIGMREGKIKGNQAYNHSMDNLSAMVITFGTK